MKNKAAGLNTLLAQAGHYVDPSTGAVNPPIHMSTTFARNANYELISGYLYSREDNPTYNQVEVVAAQLDGAAEARVFASGMAAITTVFETLNSGDHIVAPQVMYHGAQDWLRRISRKRQIGLTLFDQHDPAALPQSIQPGKTRIVWIETPVNPTWDVIDIAAAAEAAHAAGAILAVDCTVAPPVTTRALEYGADLVFHSATKYYGGHSDLLAGILATRVADERWAEIKQIRKFTGGVIGPLEAWLLLRGMRTMGLRFERASANALAIARHFEHHPQIERILYPGLASHPGHTVAGRQMLSGYGGMLSMLIRGNAQTAQRFAAGCKVLLPATSLGGVESLVEHRASVEGPESKVPQNLLRFSIGIEDVADLIADIDAGLQRMSETV